MAPQKNSTATPRRERTGIFRGSLRNRLLFAFILVVLLPTVLIVGVSAWRTYEGGRDQVYSQLESVAVLKEAEIDAWLDTMETDLRTVLVGEERDEAALALVTQDGDSEAFQESYASLNSYLRHLMGATGRFEEFFLLNGEGEVVLSTDPTQEGKIHRNETYFQRGLQGAHVQPPFYSISLGKMVVMVVRPVVNRNGESVGVLVGRASMAELENIMLERAGLGESGETYLVGTNHAMLTESRFTEDNVYVHTLGADAALHDHVNGRALYDDYRGIPIIGVYHWVPELEVALLSEQDQAEAFAATYSTLGINGGAALLATLFAAGVALAATRSIADPVTRLTDAVTLFTTGETQARTDVKTNDEVGVLASSFNHMAEQVGGLLERVEARSRELAERTRELEASQRVTFAASERVQPEELLDLIVNLIRDQFDLYHVQVYLVDDEREAAVLRESTGYAGRQLLQQKHHIPLDKPALVTQAIREGEPVLVNDVTEDPNFMPNPLLPDTRSELVVPLKVGGQVIGALDTQDRTPGRFNEATVALFQTMTDQVAFLFENSELLARITEQTEELTIFTNQLRTAADIARRLSTILDPEELLQQVVELMQSRFGLYHAHIYVMDERSGSLIVRAGSGEVGRVLRERGHSIPFTAEKSLVARAAREGEIVHVADTTVESDFMPNPLLPQTRCEVAVPLMIGQGTIAVLDVQDDQANRFSQADLDTFSTLAGQIATALQNADLFAQTQARLQVGRALTGVQTEEQVLDVLISVADLYPEAQVNIFTFDPQAEERTLVARRSDSFQSGLVSPLQPGMRFPASAFPTVNLISASEIYVSANVHKDEMIDEASREVTRQAGATSIAVLPITVDEEWIGVLTASSRQEGYFDERKLYLYQSLTEQGATALRTARLRDATRASEEQYRRLLGSLRDGFAVVDTEGQIVNCNPAFEEISGYSLEELQEMTFSDLTPHKWHAMENDILINKVLPEGFAFYEKEYIHKDGHVFPVEMAVYVFHDDGGEPAGFWGFIRDITERKRAQEHVLQEKNFSETLVDGLPGVFYLINEEGELTRWNENMERVTGYSAEEIPNMTALEFVPEEERENIAQTMQQAFTEGASSTESAFLTRDGDVLPYHFTARAVMIDGQPYITGTGIDISEQKRAQAERERFTLQLGTAAEIAGQTASILDPDVLLDTVITLLKDRFELYYAHFYRLDEETGQLVLSAGYGEPGRIMLEQGHKIPLEREQSLVARAARTKDSVVVNDVSAEPGFLPNPLLPHTKSEVAVPAIAGGRVLGVFDVQHDAVDAFTPADVDVFNTLAGQLATALQNADLFEQTQARLRVSQALAGAQSEEEVLDRLISVADFYRDAQVTLFTFDPEAEERTLIVRRHALFDSGLATPLESGMRFPASAFPTVNLISANEAFVSPNLPEDERVDEASREITRQGGATSTAILPITVGGEWLGILTASAEEVGYFDERKLYLYRSLAEQGAIALRTARLHDQVEHSLEQTRVRFDVSQALVEAQTEEAVLDALLEQAGLYPNTRIDISLIDHTGERPVAVLRRSRSFDSEVSTAGEGTRFPVTDKPLYETESPQALFVTRDVLADPRVAPPVRENAEETGAVSLAVVPIIAGGQWLGNIMASSENEDHFDEGALQLYRTLAEQGGTALHVARLRESLELTRASVDEALDSIFWFDTDANFIDVNDTVCEVLGYTREELLDMKVFDVDPVFPPDQWPQLKGDVKEHGTLNLESQHRSKDGRTFPVDVTVSYVEFGGQDYYFSFARDITERKRAEETLRLTRASVDEALDSIFWFDADANFTDVNDTVCEVLGYTREELLNMKVFDVDPIFPPEQWPQLKLDVKEHGSLNLESQHRTKDGRVFPVDVTVSHVEFGDQDYYFSFARDITERKQATEELERREERFRRMAASIPDGLTIIEGQEVVFMNERFSEIYGYPLEEARKMTGFELAAPEERERLQRVVREVREEGRQVSDLSFWIVRQDGERRYIHNRYALTRKGDEVTGRIVVTTDETERKQAEAERERFTLQLRTAAELARQVNAILDPDQLLREVVAQLRDRFDLYHVHVYLLDQETGLLEMEAGSGEVGRIMLEEGHSIPFDREQSVVARAARTREIVSVEDAEQEPNFMANPLLPDTRSEVAVPLIAGDRLLGVLDVQDDEPGYFVSSDLDVFSTLAGQVATALQNAAFFEELQRTAEQLREVDRLKSEFLANMSHELRTPLNSIIGYTEIMLMGINGELDPDTQQDVQAIYENGQHLLRIINDILDLAKVEAGRLTLNFETVEIESVIDEVKNSAAGLLVNKPIEFRIEVEEGLPVIEGDRVRLNQIFNNIVSNAIKFTEEGYVALRAFGEDGWIFVEVEDTGIGISEEDLDGIFEKFRQADGSSTRRAEGTGLGLAITRHLVEMHGGQIEVQSQVGEGSTFTVSLPLERPEEEEQGERPWSGG